jgi:DNA-binding NarL/FixJ family response regulator
MLTSFADEELVMSAIRAGAVGYLLKEVGNEEVLRGIRAAAQGNSVMDAATTSHLFARVRTAERKEEQDAFRDLTDREMAVLQEVSQGKTNAETAQSLNISEKTARNYVSALLEKLQLSNRIELATYAVKYHLSERMKRE